jgi:hypothetical protein
LARSRPLNVEREREVQALFKTLKGLVFSRLRSEDPEPIDESQGSTLSPDPYVSKYRYRTDGKFSVSLGVSLFLPPE